MNDLIRLHTPRILCVRGILSMRDREDFACDVGLSPVLRPMTTKKPREILEWLCEGDEFRHYWKRSGTLNIHRLAQDIRKQIPDSTVSQSTLARAYAGESDSFLQDTIVTLSKFFGVPAAIVRGDVEYDPVETWGVEINWSEIRLLRLIRLLSADQRRMLHEQIRLMLPEEQREIAIGPPPTNVTPISHRKTKR